MNPSYVELWHWVLFCVFTQIKKFLCPSQSIKTFILSNNLSNPTNNSEQFPTIHLPIFCQSILFYKSFLELFTFQILTSNKLIYINGMNLHCRIESVIFSGSNYSTWTPEVSWFVLQLTDRNARHGRKYPSPSGSQNESQ